MWIQGIAITLPRLQYEWSIADRWIGVATSALFAGMTLGSIAWGSCADLYGRRFVFLRTLAVTAVLGAALSFAPSFALVCALCFGVGTGVGGSMPTDGTLFLESIPKTKHFWLTALSVFFSLGSVVCALIALVFLPGNSCTHTKPCRPGSANSGWRNVILALAGIVRRDTYTDRRLCLCAAPARVRTREPHVPRRHRPARRRMLGDRGHLDGEWRRQRAVY